MEQYLSVSKMKELGTWETGLEILAFSSLCNTTVYVYCNCGGQGWRWLSYKPLTGHQTSYPCVYLVIKHGHFEPVLDVQEDVYSRTLSDSLDCRYYHYVSLEVLDSSLVNSASDEQKLRDFEDINPPHINTKNSRIDTVHPAGSTFNLLCDWSLTKFGFLTHLENL